MTNHEQHLRRTFQLAREAADRGDDPFGALLVRGGTVVAEGRNAATTENDVTAHAETQLIREAWGSLGPEALSECTLYSSTEPCAMCAGAVVNARIGTVVYGVPASRVRAEGGVAGVSFDLLAEADVKVVGPLLEQEALQVHRDHLP